MKKIIPLILCIALLISLSALADTASADAFLRSEDALVSACAEQQLTLHAAYRISLPEDQTALHERILSAYGGYEELYLLGYSHQRIKPLWQSIYACAGVLPDGTLALCPAPFDLLSRVYDPAELEKLEYTPLELP